MPSGRPLVIGSRGSPLALWQARWVQQRLRRDGHEARIEEIHTSGDRFADAALAALGGQGLFVKEIEEALLGESIALAVHSLKDMPTAQPDGLVLACVPLRDDPRDLLLAAPGVGDLRGLPSGSLVGTGSPRRACQVLSLRPDVAIKDVRGNVETRVARLRQGEYDAILLAAAGVQRLGLEVDAAGLDFEQMLPAVGQGALAIEIRSADNATRAAVMPLQDEAAATAVLAERAFLRGLGGGCQAPIAAVAEIVSGRCRLRGLVAEPSGRSILRGEREGPVADATDLGRALAEDLLERGALALLRRGVPPAAG